MIPKKIHYCWFGGKELPPIAIECIESWKNILPDYEIVRWDESNFDVESTPFTRRAYTDKKFAFVSDYVRLFALAEQGGIYMDIDEMMFKDFSELLRGKEMVACFETDRSVMVGLLAAKKDCKIISEFIEIYDNWDLSGESVNYVANPTIFTEILQKYGLVLDGTMQELNNGKVVIYPNEYFCGYDFAVYKEKITDNTYAVQKYAGTWTGGKSSRSKKMHELLVSTIGEKNYLRLKRVIKKIKG